MGRGRGFAGWDPGTLAAILVPLGVYVRRAERWNVDQYSAWMTTVFGQAIVDGFPSDSTGAAPYAVGSWTPDSLAIRAPFPRATVIFNAAVVDPHRLREELITQFRHLPSAIIFAAAAYSRPEEFVGEFFVVKDDSLRIKIGPLRDLARVLEKSQLGLGTLMDFRGGVRRNLADAISSEPDQRTDHVTSTPPAPS